MTNFHRLAQGTMFTSLPPTALLLSGIFALGATAAEQVVAVGENRPAGVVLADGDSLTNSGTIANPAGLAVSYPGPNTGGVSFIINHQTGRIEAIGGWAIGLDGSLGRFENYGSISTDTDAGLGVGGNLGSFVNTGTIATTGGAGVGVNGSTGSFDNSGTIIGGNDPAAAFNGTVGTFINSGTMQSGTGWTTVFFDDGVTSFANAGNILNTSTGRGVEANLDNGPVGTFTNSGTIAGGTGRQGVGLFGNAFGVGSFTNSGTIAGTGNTGVKIDSTVGAFTNSGTVTSTDDSAVAVDGAVGSFTNSGTLSGGGWEAVRLGMGVANFVNTSTGIIKNVNSNGVDGNGVGFNTGTLSGGQVVSFTNNGTIIGDPTGSSAGVGFFSGGDPDAFSVGTFTNTGTISGSRQGVDANGGIDVFTNSGSISSVTDQAVGIGGPVQSFINSGTIAAVQDQAIGINDAVGTFSNSGTITSTDSGGLYFDGLVRTFANTGKIESERNGVHFGGGVSNGSNSGTIRSLAGTGEIGVRIDEPGGTFTNSGTIEGATAIAYILNTTGPSTLINSGTLRGTDGSAIWFDNGDDLLALRTGSEIYGDIGFSGGNDTADVSGFSGNTLLRVFDLENVVPGDKLVHFDQANNLLAVAEPAGIVRPAQLASAGLAGQVHNMLGPVLNAGNAGNEPSFEPLGYMPVAPQTSADLAIIEPPPAPQVWATTVGGGSRDTNPVDISSLYGALVTGSHAQLAPDTTLGLLAGLGRGRVDINAGNHTVDSTSGIAGIYGRHDAGIVKVDFSVLAGVSSHQSTRQLVALGALETARADYASWFVAPAIGVAVPVLQLDAGSVDLKGQISYVGGHVSGYSETGSSLNLTVGDQGFGVLDARLGLDGTFGIEGSDTILNASGGLFIQANPGSTNVPVTFLGQTQNAALSGSTEIGLYGGLGLKAQISPSVGLTAGADAQFNFSGDVAGALRAGLVADF